MPIPMTTRTVRIDKSVSVDDDPVDTVDVWETLADGVGAHLSGPSGSDAGAGREQVDAVLYLGDETYIDRFCRVVDHGNSDEVFAVTYVERVIGFGLDHWKCGLRRVKGEAGA